LHRGHLQMLQYAKSLGDHLLVAIDTDSRVKELKGIYRPINDQYDRSYILESLKFVDTVYFFGNDEELIDLIKSYEPDIMVKGADYRNKPIIGSQYCKEIKFYEHTGHSTTDIIQRIINRG